jgi:hypothetical protein
MQSMNPELLGFSHHAGTRLAEVGFLLMLIAGVWLAAAQIPQLNALKWGRFRTVVAGGLLAIAGVLLIVAIRWGGFS